MAEAAFHFPKGFRWGTATAAHQVEGMNTNNDWWAWEQQPGRIRLGHKSGKACDWWGGRWKEDMDRAAAAGQNAHRFSVEWSRIEPEPGRYDESAIGFYREMAQGMRARGIEPMITLHHFSNPLWLSEEGGWESEKTAARFEAFARKVVAALADQVDFWCTINEPNVYAYSAFAAHDFPPGRDNIGAAFRVMRNMVEGHARAYHAIHELQPGARVGIALHYRGMIPHTANPIDALVAGFQSRIFNEAFPLALLDGGLRLPLGPGRIPQAARTQDYFGLNYYSCDRVSFDFGSAASLFGKRFYAEGSDLSEGGFIANLPDGLTRGIEWSRRFGVPIYITENGVEDAPDAMRPRYLAQHIHRLWNAVNLSMPVKGYYHWSLTDNFEWERGWTQRFGLWGLNPETQERTERPSARFFAEICKENGLNSDMVRRYAPEAVAAMFPG